jgi:type I site-specific restriction endonuclease
MDVEILIREVQDNTQHFSSNVASLERKTKLLNTAEDSVKLREEIIQLSKDTVQLAKITDSSLKKLNQQTTGTGQSDRLAYGRLTKAFQLSLQKFQPLQQSVADLEQDLVTRARSASSVRTPDSASFQPEFERAREPLVHHDSLARERQMQIEENEAAQLEEREREMRQLETDILDINDIFRDLGTMVHDQGDLVDNIETQVETAAVRVESGNTQLAKAVRHKKCSRKLTCCIACILLGILAAVIIAVFVLLAIFTDLFKKKN